MNLVCVPVAINLLLVALERISQLPNVLNFKFLKIYFANVSVFPDFKHLAFITIVLPNGAAL